MKGKAKTEVGRRDFLRGLGLGAGVAAAGAAPFAATAVASQSETDRKKARYRETDHIKAFYQVNRYPPKKS
jgi:hypothetical protein